MCNRFFVSIYIFLKFLYNKLKDGPWPKDQETPAEKTIGVEKSMVKQLVHDPMFLAQKSLPATKEDAQVITDLLDTLNANLDTCVGMAANMIGVKKNIIVVSFGFAKMVMVNARIIRKKGPYRTEESCASLLGGPRQAIRYGEIEVEYEDADFQKKRETFIGWTAQIIQHELDHVEGKLI